MAKVKQNVNPIENPDFGKTITYDGKTYNLVDLSKEAREVFDEIMQAQKDEIETGKNLMRIEGIKMYLNTKLKNLLPKSEGLAVVHPSPKV